MKYISLFSGIEAVTVAWEPLGWEPVAFSEIEPDACAVLHKRFPGIENVGNICTKDWTEYAGAIDIIAGGSPCQSFSIAGKREGLHGQSGLMFEYIRAVSEIMPRCFIWENVPGALSSEGGDAFAQLLREMDELGYGLAWRILDAQFFGVPQRRRRIFLVGCLGDRARAAEILFEPESVSWDTASSRNKRQELTRAAKGGTDAGRVYGLLGNVCDHVSAQNGSGVSEEVAPTLNTVDRHANAHAPVIANCLTPWDVQSRRVFCPDTVWPSLYSGAGGGGGYVLQDTRAAVAFSAGQSAKAGTLGLDSEVTPTLRGGSSGTNQLSTVAYAPAYTMLIRCGKPGGGKGALVQTDMSATLATANSQTLFQPAPELICMASARANAEIMDNCGTSQLARQYKDPPIVATKYIVRRLMPVECERLQGFPDGWTDVFPLTDEPSDELVDKFAGIWDEWCAIEGNKPRSRKWVAKWLARTETPDAPRYKQLGNSMAVPVMGWLGLQIERTKNGQ